MSLSNKAHCLLSHMVDDFNSGLCIQFPFVSFLSMSLLQISGTGRVNADEARVIRENNDGFSLERAYIEDFCFIQYVPHTSRNSIKFF